MSYPRKFFDGNLSYNKEVNAKREKCLQVTSDVVRQDVTPAIVTEAIRRNAARIAKSIKEEKVLQEYLRRMTSNGVIVVCGMDDCEEADSSPQNRPG
jgi:hypothetical protein